VASPPRCVVVALAGRRLTDALLGVPVVVTPGTVALEASAPGHQVFRRDVEVASAATVTVVVALQPEVPAPVADVAPPPALPAPTRVPPLTPALAPALVPARSVRLPTANPFPLGSIASWGLMGTGVLAALTGLVLYWGVAQAMYQDLANRCATYCDAAELAQATGSIHAVDLAANVVGWTGLAIAAGGAMVQVVTAASGARQPSARVGWALVGAGGIAALTGLVLYWGVAQAMHQDLASRCALRCDAMELARASVPIYGVDLAANIVGWTGLATASFGAVLQIVAAVNGSRPRPARVGWIVAPGFFGLAGAL
jgi:hypothetical protein